jgi:predicted 3-demethylubiquinone-9 3-methyltransferase (glyoxalase superfamily)
MCRTLIASESQNVGAAVTFSVNCETQDEIDYFWEKLCADGGSTKRCGWLKDKSGLSWQVNPVFLGDMLRAMEKDLNSWLFVSIRGWNVIRSSTTADRRTHRAAAADA